MLSRRGSTTTAFLSPSTVRPFLSSDSFTSSFTTNSFSSRTPIPHASKRLRPLPSTHHQHITCITGAGAGAGAGTGAGTGAEADLPDLSSTSSPSTPSENSPSINNGNGYATGNGNGAISNGSNTSSITNAEASTESSSDVLTAPTASAIYKFTRPHTIRGTILAAFAGCARAILESPASIDLALIPRACIGLAALLFGNAYIVGINQIYDVRLDRINKPFLPIASRELSKSNAWIIVVSSAILGLLIVKFYFSPLIFSLYAFGMVFGTLYSVPPFRFKRYPLLAAITISCVRGFLLNFGVYHATKNALSIPFHWSPPITFLAVFMTIFATVIALSKDLPDIKGDRAEGIPTFASKMGPHRLIAVVYAMLTVNYAGAILTAGLAPDGAFNRLALGGGHFVLAVWLIAYMTGVRPSSKESIKKFYAFIWKLFYAEYLLFPFI